MRMLFIIYNISHESHMTIQKRCGLYNAVSAIHLCACWCLLLVVAVDEERSNGHSSSN